MPPFVLSTFFLSLLFCVHRTCVNTHIDVKDRLCKAGDYSEEYKKNSSLASFVFIFFLYICLLCSFSLSFLKSDQRAERRLTRRFGFGFNTPSLLFFLSVVHHCFFSCAFCMVAYMFYLSSLVLNRKFKAIY